MIIRNRTLAWATCLAIVAVPTAHATNGYFAHGYGTESKGMAGAGVALPLSALSPATNPASLAFLDSAVDLGVSVFSPDRSYRVSGTPSGMQGTFGLTPGRVESASKGFVVPTFGMNYRLNDRTGVGLAVYGNGGMSTDYEAATFYQGNAGVDLSQLFLAPTLARELVPGHALGLTPIIAYQRFEARGLAAFGQMSCDASCLTGRDHDNSYGYGARVGYLGRLAPSLALGASYQSRLAMSEFDHYQGLFAESGDFDIPSNWTAGLAFEPNAAWTLMADVQQIRYSEVEAVGNPLLPNLQSTPLGTDGGAGFGWRDMTVYKLGLQYEASRDWTFRAGYSYGEQPIPDSEVLMNILAPGVMEQHATLGLSRLIGPTTTLHLAATHAFDQTVKGQNLLEVPGAQEIELEMKQWDFELGLSFGL
ncbi:MAG: outer membrane protein transport protein [Candidatus Eisenbacteria bacterium]|nr:outer membrane protein transport protein [Candidatus Eisenbacteria bacterium]MCC7143455.1 outer membrane protein transport protein [Candidatus Eisenbacteria bacterium]